jgi:hypothetical protein
MTVTYVEDNRRDDLRAAALFVVDDERQEHGFDKRVKGSVGVPDVIRIFDEMLAVFPLESEVGDAIRTPDEIPCWRVVSEKMDPVWKLWPAYGSQPVALIETDAWSALREAVQRCVDTHRLWHEEIEYPVTLVANGRSLQADTWSELERLSSSLTADVVARDVRGRQVELELASTVGLRRVGLPLPTGR